MELDFQKAFIAGLERVAAWSDLLDRINVFPVADGDTGRNLLISLTPLRQISENIDDTIHKLLLSARGNSGNIASRFLSGFLKTDSLDGLVYAVKQGREFAWSAVNDPKAGTMLTVFDCLDDILQKNIINENADWVDIVVKHLEQAVKSTPEFLPKLKEAGVVDSGALGMFLYFEGFLYTLVKKDHVFMPLSQRFEDLLSVSSSFNEEIEDGYCIDMVLQVERNSDEAIKMISEFGESVVVIPENDYLKVHLHADNREEVREKVAAIGNVVRWSDDDLGDQIKDFQAQEISSGIRIITDAAGSVTKEDSQNLGIILLDSYVTAGDKSMPETFFPTQELYESMEKGVRASTSQSSQFERFQHYQSIVSQYDKVLYLCVGSVYTGNYEVAIQWKKNNDEDDSFRVIDTGTASGCLGLIAIATARYAAKVNDFKLVEDYAIKVIDLCQEFLFLDKLHYLAAGGRMSKTGAFFGELFNVKPVVSPAADGARKVAVVRNSNDQIKFAIDKLKETLDGNAVPLIMLEYTNNREWVDNSVRSKVARLFPSAEIILQPLSLTTGVHTGPGTWGIAFIPKTE